MTESHPQIGVPKFPRWIKETPPVSLDKLDFCAQVTVDEVLLARLNEDGSASCNFIVYDKRRKLPRHFAPPDDLLTALRGHHSRGLTLRFEDRGDGYFFSEKTTELRFIRGEKVKSIYFHMGLEADGQRRNVRIATFFVTAERVLLIDIERGLLLSLDKSAVLRGFEEAEDHGDWRPLDIEDPEFDLRMSPFGPRKDEDTKVIDSFDRERIFFASPDIGSGIQYLCVHSFDIDTETLRDYEWPVIPDIDLGYLFDLFERRPSQFMTYLITLPAIADYSDDLSKGTVGFRLLWLEDEIIFRSGSVLAVRLKDAEAGGREALEPKKGRLRDLYSRMWSFQQRGVVQSLQALEELHSSSLEEYLARRYRIDQLAAMLEPEILKPDVDVGFLLRMARVLYRMPGHIELGRAWLTEEPAKRWIAAGLLEGRVVRSSTDRILENKHREEGPVLADFKEIYPRPQDIPAAEVRKAAEEAIMAARAASSGERIMEAPPGSDLNLNLIHRILVTVVSWQTPEGDELIRHMASQGVAEIDYLVADIIRDRRLESMRDIALVYLGHDDAFVVKTAISALRDIEAGDAEDGLLRLLGRSDRAITGPATKGLSHLGTEKSLTALSYADVIECFLDEIRVEGNVLPARNPRTGSFAEGAINAILERLGSDLELDLRSEGWEVRLEEKRRLFAENTLLNFYRDACRDYRDSKTTAGNRKFKREMHLESVDHHPDLDCMQRWIDAKTFLALSRRGVERRRAVLEILKRGLETQGSSDMLYLPALIFHLAPRFLRFDWRSSLARDIAVCLRVTYERMRGEEDFRGILAVFALLELGVDRKWERAALDVFERGDWRGWPRLMRVGIRVLRRLPAEKRLRLHETLLKDIGGGPGYEETLFDVAESRPRTAVKLYERGIFRLSPIKEALLYGMVGDLRGYQNILNVPPASHDRETIEYLKKHGGFEAIPVIENALDRWHTPADVMNDVLKEVGKRKARIGF